VYAATITIAADVTTHTLHVQELLSDYKENNQLCCFVKNTASGYARKKTEKFMFSHSFKFR
jgi:hypothetical protein